MDVSYNPHAERARRKIRSATNLNHLTLAPLTSRLPINDDELFDNNDDPSLLHPSTSYLQGKSAPATPRLLASSARSPRARSRAQSYASSGPGLGLGLEGLMTKSTSSPHIANGQSGRRRRAVSGTATPRRRQQQLHHHNHHQQEDDAATNGDWLLRTGAFMAIEAREFKGQSWLASRQSSTSLAGLRSAEEEAFEQDLHREREMTSRRASRRGSAADDDVSVLGSRMPSRIQSRSQSIAASRSRIMTPSIPASMTLALDRGAPASSSVAAAAAAAAADEGFLFHNSAFVEPDFVDLDEKLENLERDTLLDDEADVRKLMRRTSQGRGRGSWLANMIGWSLFSVEEHEGEFGDDDDDNDDSEDESLDGDGAHAGGGGGYDDDFEDGRSRDGRSGWLKRHCEGPLDPDELVPPPETNQGGWSDAAWLLSVATKVIF
ncbi:hypothetical protein ESCO_001013 [Escovopsis weberi]|uniref:Uncharacterized protein n=1 Tax=Escovopsis weberi TaxID=150374 RepID=A0A0M9VU24_ESCWE|nr:hypothetical protein ESCO_001013 [Escovopsis weberi]